MSTLFDPVFLANLFFGEEDGTLPARETEMMQYWYYDNMMEIIVFGGAAALMISAAAKIIL
jgi:hypothetical protein